MPTTITAKIPESASFLMDRQSEPSRRANFPAQDDILAFEARDTVTLSSPQVPGLTQTQDHSNEQSQSATDDEKVRYEIPENPLKLETENEEEQTIAPPGQTKPSGETLTVSERMEIADLKHRDKEIRAHEKAHLAAAAAYAQSGATYEYVKGPDGKSYAVHGEVMINSSSADTPEGTIKKMKVVRSAALAPASPSPQDLKVAASATRRMTKAAQELRLDKLDEAKSKFHQEVQRYERVEKEIEEEQTEQLELKGAPEATIPEKLDTSNGPLLRFHVKSYQQSAADIAKYQYNSLELYT
nr:hypothetical protein [Desulfobulbaceae bacterium]